MREILSRGKRIDNGEWVEGNLFVPDKEDTPTQICIGTNIVRITYDIISETVGQYTGLTDKNGKKIFEGDIIKWGLKLCVIKWDECNASFCLYVYGTTKVAGFNQETMKLKEVIGNIHDNPELLEGDTR